MENTHNSTLEVDLTARELEVMQAVWDGSTAAEIGNALFISRRTVEWHIDNVKEKISDALGTIVTSRHQCVKLLSKIGLVN